MQPNLTDPDGTILVYTDPAEAHREGLRRGLPPEQRIVVGMGDEKWKMFQHNEKYRVVR